MTASERTTFESGRASDIAALESTLAVAWIGSNIPAAGEEGSSCEGSDGNADLSLCTTSTHCCGTSTPRTGAYVNPTLENLCVDSTSLEYSLLDITYDHVCASGAYKMAATMAATVAALYSLA
jgi:hypothetical protein